MGLCHMYVVDVLGDNCVVLLREHELGHTG